MRLPLALQKVLFLWCTTTLFVVSPDQGTEGHGSGKQTTLAYGTGYARRHDHRRVLHRVRRRSRLLPLQNPPTKLCSFQKFVPCGRGKKNGVGRRDTHIYLLSLALALSIHNKQKK